jgi:hypothetical protein
MPASTTNHVPPGIAAAETPTSPFRNKTPNDAADSVMLCHMTDDAIVAAMERSRVEMERSHKEMKRFSKEMKRRQADSLRKEMKRRQADSLSL